MLLDVQDLHTGYGPREVLHGINLTVDAGEVVVVLGTNGAGKSTLLKCIAGLVGRKSGTISFLGSTIDRDPAYKRVRKGLVLVPEGQQTFPAMSVAENLWIGAQASGNSDSNRTEQLDRVLQRFPRLAERRKQSAGTLSGGERQMLAIGRALLAEPSVLMLDEPSHGLSPVLVEQVADIVQDISQTTALLIVEQNLLIPTRCATRVLILAEGRVEHEGSADEVLESEAVMTAYLGI